MNPHDDGMGSLKRDVRPPKPPEVATTPPAPMYSEACEGCIKLSHRTDLEADYCHDTRVITNTLQPNGRANGTLARLVWKSNRLCNHGKWKETEKIFADTETGETR